MDKLKKLLWASHSDEEKINTVELKSHVGEMQTWMRNLEQHLMSLNARLGAVEQRISESSGIGSPDVVDEEDENQLTRKPIILMDNLTIDQVQRLDNEIRDITQSLTSLKQHERSMRAFKNDTEEQLKKMKHRKNTHSVIMKLGKKEIPLELSGIIGGFICFLVAGLVIFDATEIVLSPWFLTGIGALLLSGTFLRTEFSVYLIKKLGRLIFPQSHKTGVHQSDSTS